MRNLALIFLIGVWNVVGCGDGGGNKDGAPADGSATDGQGDGAGDMGVGDGGGVDAGGDQMNDLGGDTSGSDMGPSDTGPADTGPADTGPADTGPGDTGPADTGPADTGPADTGPPDIGSADTGPADTGPADTGPADTGPADTEPTCLAAPADLVGFWPGDGSGENLVFGGSAAGWVGTPKYAAAEVGTGFDLSSGAHTEAPTYAGVEITGSVTIAAWISSETWGGRIVDKMTATASDGYLLDTDKDRLRMLAGSAAASTDGPLPKLTLGSFIFVAGVYDAGTKAITLYVHGEASTSTGTPGGPPKNTTQPVRFGADSNGVHNFGGIIDEPMIFARALTAKEIAAIYEAGALGVCH